MTKRVGILTSGGDCPGLNPAIVTAAAVLEDRGIRPVGIRLGFEGLCRLGQGEPAGALTMDLRGLERGRWMREGGTMLGSRRHNLTKLEGALAAALAGAEATRLDALIVLGGDGSLRGALALADSGLEVIGIPKTIDRDVAATDEVIGFHSALETGTEAVERIATSARSHGLAFFIEVMGRRSGALAAAVARCTGADGLLVPERPASFEALGTRLTEHPGDRGCVVVLAEGYWPEGLAIPSYMQDEKGRLSIGDTARTLERMLGETGLPVRSTRLGHSLRGGRPNAADRLVAASLAVVAARAVGGPYGSALAVVRDGRAHTVSLREADRGRRVLTGEELDQLAGLLW